MGGASTQEMLDAAAMATMMVPVAGDVAGLASDAYRFATDPESRTLGNAAWASLGMLPFVPHAGMLLDAKQLLRPRGKIDAMYEPWSGFNWSGGTGGDARHVSIYKNPTDAELNRLLDKHGYLRKLDPKGTDDRYVWPGDEALHQQVAQDVLEQTMIKDLKTGVVTPSYRGGTIARGK
jgi:hypothetical protein